MRNTKIIIIILTMLIMSMGITEAYTCYKRNPSNNICDGQYMGNFSCGGNWTSPNNCTFLQNFEDTTAHTNDYATVNVSTLNVSYANYNFTMNYTPALEYFYLIHCSGGYVQYNNTRGDWTNPAKGAYGNASKCLYQNTSFVYNVTYRLNSTGIIRELVQCYNGTGYAAIVNQTFSCGSEVLSGFTPFRENLGTVSDFNLTMNLTIRDTNNNSINATLNNTNTGEITNTNATPQDIIYLINYSGMNNTWMINKTGWFNTTFTTNRSNNTVIANMSNTYIRFAYANGTLLTNNLDCYLNSNLTNIINHTDYYYTFDTGAQTIYCNVSYPTIIPYLTNNDFSFTKIATTPLNTTITLSKVIINISAFDNWTMTNLTNFTVTLTDLNLSTVQVQNSSNNVTNFNVIVGNTINIMTFSNGYALDYYNHTVLTNDTIIRRGLFYHNSVRITILDDITSALINELVNMNFIGLTYLANYSTTNGTKYVSNLSPDTYNVIFTTPSLNYSTRAYTITVTNQSTQALDARLLNSSLTNQIGIYVRNSLNQIIPNALINIQQNTGGSWVTIINVNTDTNGFAYVNIQQGVAYRVTLSNTGFNTNQFLFTFYLALSPYTFTLSSSTTASFSNSFNDVLYNYGPLNTTLENGTNTFSLNAFSNSDSLDWIRITTTLGQTNLSTSSTGMEVTQTEDVSAYSGQTYPVIFCYKTGGYDEFCFTVNYWVRGTTPYTNNLMNTLETFKTEMITTDTGTVWLSILAMFITLVVAMQLTQLIMNPAATTIGTVLTIIFFGIIGWVDVIIVGFIGVGTIILFFWNRSGGGMY